MHGWMMNRQTEHTKHTDTDQHTDRQSDSMSKCAEHAQNADSLTKTNPDSPMYVTFLLLYQIKSAPWSINDKPRFPYRGILMGVYTHHTITDMTSH